MSQSIEAIRAFIKDHGYTYTIADIFYTYKRYYLKGYYCSYTSEIVIENNLHHFKVIDNYFKKKNKYRFK